MTPKLLAGVVVVAIVAGGVGLFVVNSSKPSQALTGTATSNTSTTLKGSNGWQLDVPVGAVPADRNGNPGTIVVSVDKAAAPTNVDTSNVPSSVKLSGDVYQIEPEGQTFVTPVTLTLPIPQDLQADKVGGIAYLDVGTRQWVVEPAEVDVAAGVIRARITHFSLMGAWGDYRAQLQAWQKKSGGYFDVTNTHVATEFFPSEHFGVPLPRYGGHSVLYGFCISQMAFDDPNQMKDSSWYVPVPDMFTVFTMPDGHNPGGTKSYWLPNGTYAVDEVWYGGEFVPVADPFYSPVFGFAHRPLGNLTVTAGSHRAFEESSVTLQSADGWAVGRSDCAGNVVPTPSHSTSPSHSASASTATTGTHWVLTSTTSDSGGPRVISGTTGSISLTIDTSNGRIAWSYTDPKPPPVFEGSVSWGPPPASAAPGDTWTTTLLAQITCSDALDTTDFVVLTVNGLWPAGQLVTPGAYSHVGASCQQGSASTALSWVFPAHDGDLFTIVVHGGGPHGGDNWNYTYQWQP